MHFGATLRLLRVESGLTLRDFARRLGVSGAYLSRVENGLDAPPTAPRLEAMAKELGVPPTLLMDLAQRVSPLVVDYVEQFPEAGTLFLEIAHRRLDGRQLRELRAILDRRFPEKGATARALPSLSELLRPSRVVLRLACSDMDDVFDVAAGRLAEACPGTTAQSIAAALRKREVDVSSALGNGVAVPSVYVARSVPAAALVTLASPIRYETPDKKPLRLVVVLLGPRDAGGRMHRLAHIARLAAHGLAGRIESIESPATALSRLAALESSS
jgi:PTS system nitrogen regulatory IIA component